ncbi:MAG: HAD family hydrolase [Jannaschia sp.]
MTEPVGAPAIRAILFDKDGTFTDFRATWEPWMPGALRDLARESGADARVISEAVGIDPDTGSLRPDGAFVTGTDAKTAAILSPITGWSEEAVIAWWSPRVNAVPQAVVTPVEPLLAGLRERGLILGVLTNADEAGARHHLAAMGALPHLHRVIGYDSGFGPKPEPRGAASFADELGLDREAVVLVGDGMTDMLAARDAGLRAVAVTTGTLDRAALTPHAEAVLDDVSQLPDWLDRLVS